MYGTYISKENRSIYKVIILSLMIPCEKWQDILQLAVRCKVKAAIFFF